jgi:hypothetical protein
MIPAVPLLRINRRPSGAQLAVFALAWLAVLGRIAWILRGRGELRAATAVVVLAAGVPLAGLVRREALRLAYVGLATATYPIGAFVSQVVLAAAFYLVLTPIGAVLRAAGHDPLQRRFEPSAGTYWSPRRGPRAAASYLRQD